MLKSQSSAKKECQQDIKTLLEELGPMTLQTLCWWKLCSIPPTILLNRVQEFTKGTTGTKYHTESSTITQNDLINLSFSEEKPGQSAVVQVYKEVEKNRLTRLPPELLRQIFDSVNPMEGGGGGVLTQFAFCKAVFPLLERYWEFQGPKSLDLVLRSVICSSSLVSLPSVYTEFRLAQDAYLLINREAHRCWVLEGNPLPKMLRYLPPVHGLQERLPRRDGGHWVENFKYQIEKMFAFHVKETHGGYSPELVLSCLFGTANSPPCNLEAHYQTVARKGTSKYIVININAADQTVLQPTWPGKVNERIFLTVRELCRIQRILGLASFMTETGRDIMKHLTASTDDWVGQAVPVDGLLGDSFEAADKIIEKLQDRNFRNFRIGRWISRWIRQ